jgi:DNA/RNA-binding protein KIN17
MNSTRWKTLTEFITFLGHEGICRVENTDKGWFISWIDNSPEALKRRDANLKRGRLEKGDADREDRLLQEQIERAKQEALEKQMDTVYDSVYMKSEDDDDVKLEAETEMRDINSEDDVSIKLEDEVSVKFENSETTSTPMAPILAIQKLSNISVPAPITLKKPLNPLMSSNPLASKKSSNPLKSAMKVVKKEESLPSVNTNGKRPLPKAVEIMQEEQRLKRLREERYNRDHYKDDRYRDHRSQHRGEMYVESR